MSKLAKFVAWLSLFVGALTLLTPALIYGLRNQLVPTPALVICLALGIGGMLGGYFGLKGKPLAFWLLTLMYLVQVVEYLSPTVSISFMGPLAIKFGWGWYSPPSQININILAVALTVLSFACVRRLTFRSSGRAEPRAA